MTSWNVGDGLGEQYTELYEVQAMEGRTFIMVDWTGDPPAAHGRGEHQKGC